MTRRKKYDADHPSAVAARARVSTIIDAVDPVDLVRAIKEAPSLRGMMLGYVAELMFEQHLPKKYPIFVADDIISHDDHDRSSNKSDRTLRLKGQHIRVQLKSVQTATIKFDEAESALRAYVQNDGSDRRDVTLSDGSIVNTTCYKVGDYDILAVPLFPFTGNWDFAYKRNTNCRRTKSTKYTEKQREELLATTEIISWPLNDEWTINLMDLIERGATLEVE